MSDRALLEQSATISSILQRLMRRFSVPDDGDPAMELPLAQLKVCGILRDGSRTITALSRELGISVSAITQLADRLERSGMVERVPGIDDRRMRSLMLTSEGMEIMRKRQENRIRHVAAALGELTQEQRDTVIQALEVLLRAGVSKELGEVRR